MRIKREKKEDGFGVVGKVTIGERHPQKGYPQSLDYFRFAAKGGGAPTATIRLAEARYPHDSKNKRSELPILFTSDCESNLQHYFELRDKGGNLIANHNGQTIHVKATDRFKRFIIDNPDMLKSPQKKDGYITLVDGVDLLPDGPLGDLDKFTSMLLAKAKKEAPNQRVKDNIEWAEKLVMRFLLVNFPIMGRWELITKGKASSIQNILNAYDQIVALKGTIVDTHFLLSVQKVKGESKSKQFSVVSLAPIVDAQNANNGTLPVNVLNGNMDGLKVIDAPKPNSEPPKQGGDFTDFQEV